MPKTVHGEGAGQRTGIPDFESVGKQSNFDRGVAVIVPVGDSIDDGFTHGIGREFIGRRRSDADIPDADSAVNPVENKIAGKVCLLEKITTIDLHRYKW